MSGRRKQWRDGAIDRWLGALVCTDLANAVVKLLTVSSVFACAELVAMLEKSNRVIGYTVPKYIYGLCTFVVCLSVSADFCSEKWKETNVLQVKGRLFHCFIA